MGRPTRARCRLVIPFERSFVDISQLVQFTVRHAYKVAQGIYLVFSYRFVINYYGVVQRSSFDKAVLQ